MPRYLICEAKDGKVVGSLETVNTEIVEAVGVEGQEPNAVIKELNRIIEANRSASNHKPKATVIPGSDQEKVLAYVRDNKGTDSIAVRKALGLTSNAVTGALKHLCEKGLLSRWRLGAKSVWKYEAV